VRLLPTLKVWNTQTHRTVATTLAGPRAGVVGAFFTTTDSTQILAISRERQITMWRLNEEISANEKLHWHHGAQLEIEARTKAVFVTEERMDNDKEIVDHESKNKDEDVAEEILDSQFYKQDTDLRDRMLFLSSHTWDEEKREQLAGSGKVGCADFNISQGILVCGFTEGTFAVCVTKPEFAILHTLSATAQQITGIILSPSGNWIALASSRLHQLLVWEWKTETHIWRHQSHYSDIDCVCYNSDGTLLVTGGEDGKIKVWRSDSGQCVGTFPAHHGAVLGLVANTANAVYSASRDGTLRGFDLHRLKEFRTLTPPRRSQLSCLALDPSGELLAAGTMDTGHIYLWATQTGRFLDEFTGHTAYCTHIAFHPKGTFMASVSWDKSVRMYDLFGVDESSGERIRGSVESLTLSSEGMCVQYSPDGNYLVTLDYDSNMVTYDLKEELGVVHSWNVRLDTQGGYVSTTPNPKSTNSKRPFTTFQYSPRGDTLLVAGECKWVCLYSSHGGYLLCKWSVSDNRSLEGHFETYDWRKNLPGVSVNELDDEDSDAEDRYRKLLKLPGVKKGTVHSVGKRSTQRVARTTALAFAPNGREWVASTTAGVLVYALPKFVAPRFLPHHLRRHITPKDITELLRNEPNYGNALLLALQLGEGNIIRKVLLLVPCSVIEIIVPTIPQSLLCVLLQHVAELLESDSNYEHNLTWCMNILYYHGSTFLERSNRETQPHISHIFKALRQKSDIFRISEENKNMLQYLVSAASMES